MICRKIICDRAPLTGERRGMSGKRRRFAGGPPPAALAPRRHTLRLRRGLAPLPARRRQAQRARICGSSPVRAGFCRPRLRRRSTHRRSLRWASRRPSSSAAGTSSEATSPTSGSIERAEADNIGMLGTVMNGILLRGVLKHRGLEDVRLMTALPMPSMAEPFIRLRALSHLERERLVLLACGIGQPYVTTDYPAVQRAIELRADAILLAKHGTDGIYDRDPRKESRSPAIRQPRLQGRPGARPASHGSGGDRAGARLRAAPPRLRLRRARRDLGHLPAARTAAPTSRRRRRSSNQRLLRSAERALIAAPVMGRAGRRRAPGG